jgi:hypothetical protein
MVSTDVATRYDPVISSALEALRRVGAETDKPAPDFHAYLGMATNATMFAAGSLISPTQPKIGG